ncbi:MAG: DUF4395 domain-containing protein [Trueperaceae bacterium]|nr:DUF4395 domain-containing protein [Trueperaceae bacterium]
MPDRTSATNSKITPLIDARGPRFGAAITSVLLLVTLFLALTGPQQPPFTSSPAFILLVLLALSFAWGAFAGIRSHPYSVLYRRVVQPRLRPATEFEDPAPPTFAQFVGHLVSVIGLALAVFGVPWGLPAAAAAAFVAAFLNAAFGYCLGCQLYLLLARLRRAGT